MNILDWHTRFADEPRGLALSTAIREGRCWLYVECTTARACTGLFKDLQLWGHVTVARRNPVSLWLLARGRAMRRLLGIVVCLAGLVWDVMLGWFVQQPATEARERVRTAAFCLMLGAGLLATPDRRKGMSRRSGRPRVGTGGRMSRAFT